MGSDRKSNKRKAGHEAEEPAVAPVVLQSPPAPRDIIKKGEGDQKQVLPVLRLAFAACPAPCQLS